MRIIILLLTLVLLYFSIKYKKIQHFSNRNTKFGVMWANTINIGDDFQTLAAINLLKKNNIHEYVFINREKLSEYDGEPVVLIMNGWYMHDISKFPPSKKITPIFISVYVEHEKLISENIDYFKKHEPIGCRDLSTKKLFEKYNVKAYFSGCLTLCFDEHNQKGNKNYIVDLKGSNGGSLKDNKINLKSKLKNVEYIKHNYFNNSDKNRLDYRLKEAQKILNKYKEANLILTSRLHVALPCRAFNTNVKFIHQNYNKDKRFKGLTNILNGGTKNIEDIEDKIDRKLINKFKHNIKIKFSKLINKNRN
jgi:hypothetical protein